MTRFEELAHEIGIEITVDKYGFYTGLSQILADITCKVILSDDDKVFNMSWEEQKKLIKKVYNCEW